MSERTLKIGGRRMMLLCDGNFDLHNAKTATGLIIWCPDEVVAVVDSQTAGRDVGDVIGFGRGIPVVATVAEAAELGANQLVVGVANLGGFLVPGFRPQIVAAMRLGCDVFCGLHEILAHDPEFSAVAKERGVKIHDLRLVPPVPVATNKARRLPNKRILMVGSDCNSGKMCTALALHRDFLGRGLDAEFVATGQTGIMISGWGYCIDRAISDFAAGIAEELALQARDHEWVFVEGQGSIDHPGYSGVTLSLLHGSAPQALVLCHVCGRTERRHDDGSRLEPLPKLRQIYELVSEPILPAKVVGASLMTKGLDDAAARAELKRVEDELGVPATDPLRYGVRNLSAAIMEFYQARK